MPEQIQCPICQAMVSANAKACPVCGASIAQITAPDDPPAAAPESPDASAALGKDDLFLPGAMRLTWWGGVIPLVVVAALLVGLVIVAGSAFFQDRGLTGPNAAATTSRFTPVATLAQPGGAPLVFATNTPPQATLFLPTLTPPPTSSPTATPTETPGPCEQVVGEGDTLIMLAMRCGHESMDVLDAILDMNGLSSPESLQLGQRVFIPWPTPTPGPAVENTAGAPDESGESSLPTAEMDAEDAAAAALAALVDDAQATPTLQPGVMWYTVQSGDTILSIAVQFNANVEILSQLNPEVTFSQCDYGMDSGGPNCIVQLVSGQRLRVPAPTPTPTLSPTPSGSETPTPTPTPTFNAPSLYSPGNRALFGPDEIITLRWVTTASLTEGEVYLVTIEDQVTGAVYTAATTETFFIVPDAWQPTDGERHEFTWLVAVGPSDGGGGLASVTFSTAPWTFFWDSPT